MSQGSLFCSELVSHLGYLRNKTPLWRREGFQQLGQTAEGCPVAGSQEEPAGQTAKRLVETLNKRDPTLISLGNLQGNLPVLSRE